MWLIFDSAPILVLQILRVNVMGSSAVPVRLVIPPFRAKLECHYHRHRASRKMIKAAGLLKVSYKFFSWFLTDILQIYFISAE